MCRCEHENTSFPFNQENIRTQRHTWSSEATSNKALEFRWACWWKGAHTHTHTHNLQFKRCFCTMSTMWSFLLSVTFVQSIRPSFHMSSWQSFVINVPWICINRQILCRCIDNRWDTAKLKTWTQLMDWWSELGHQEIYQVCWLWTYHVYLSVSPSHDLLLKLWYSLLLCHLVSLVMLDTGWPRTGWPSFSECVSIIVCVSGG